MSGHESLRAVPAWMRLSIWCHRKRNVGHHSLLRHVSPGFNIGATRGYFVRCTGCERTWAA